MTTPENSKINALFTLLEKAVAWSEHLNFKSLYAIENQEAYGTVFGEALAEVFQIQKRIVRAFLKAGELGELFAHIEVGTLPPLIIQAATGRL